MNTMNRTLAASLFALTGLVACADDNNDTRTAGDISEVANYDIAAPEGCEPLVAIARPIAAPHFHDAMLQQTAGTLTLRFGDIGVRTGTSLATIVGLDASGAPLGNHDWLFTDGGFRTQNDKLALIPTTDPCKFDVRSEIYIVEGSGVFAGYGGTVQGVGTVDFCGAPGKVTITGAVCPL